MYLRLHTFAVASVNKNKYQSMLIRKRKQKEFFEKKTEVKGYSFLRRASLDSHEKVKKQEREREKRKKSEG